jgi:hypothetical protein
MRCRAGSGSKVHDQILQRHMQKLDQRPAMVQCWPKQGIAGYKEPDLHPMYIGPISADHTQRGTHHPTALPCCQSVSKHGRSSLSLHESWCWVCHLLGQRTGRQCPSRSHQRTRQSGSWGARLCRWERGDTTCGTLVSDSNFLHLTTDAAVTLTGQRAQEQRAVGAIPGAVRGAPADCLGGLLGRLDRDLATRDCTSTGCGLHEGGHCGFGLATMIVPGARCWIWPGDP